MNEENWYKSSYSQGGENGECVEVNLSAGVGVRDTKDRAAGHIVVGAASWAALIAAVSTTH